MKPTIGALSVLAALTCTAIGCAQQQPAPRPPEMEDPAGVVGRATGTLITSLDVGAGRVVRFYEVEPGLMVVTETGKVGDQPPVLTRLEHDSPVDVFKALAPDRTVPAALVAAERRRNLRGTEAMTSPPPGDASMSKGEGPSFYTAAEQAWFAQTFCVSGFVVKCIQGWDWIDSGWDYSASWTSTAFVGSEGLVSAPHVAYWWDCSSGSCGWSLLNYAIISPGHYQTLSGYGGWFYFKSTLTGAGPNTQVSVAITNAS